MIRRIIEDEIPVVASLLTKAFWDNSNSTSGTANPLWHRKFIKG